MNELNHHQMVIVNNLAFKLKAKFAELNTDKITSDQFNYHIKALIENGFLEKDSENFYSLTLKGRKFVSETDIFNLTIEKQSKIHVGPVCVRENNGKTEYLLHRRTKHPYFGWMGIPTGKPKFGNFYEQEVIRELEEETGLTGRATLKIMLHCLMSIEGSEQIDDDRVFYYYKIEDIQNELIEKTIEGENYWMTEEEIMSSDKVFPDTIWIVKSIDNDGILYKEKLDAYANI